MIERLHDRVLLRPSDVSPSRDDLRVVGAFNPGAARWREETVLLVRVVEAPTNAPEDGALFPRWAFDSGEPQLVIDRFRDDELDTTDHREVFVSRTGLVRLPFISHLRLARSADGRTIDWVDPQPTVTPQDPSEAFGIEDARLTPLAGEDRCAITYVAPSRHGIISRLAVTDDFRTFRRLGTITVTENKDVCLLPTRTAAGRYAMLHRPLGRMLIHKPEIWYAESPDLVHWGGHRVLLSSEPGGHLARIGAGLPPLVTDQGLLEIYHAAYLQRPEDRIGTYCAAAVLLDPDEPWRVIARSDEPLLVPTAPHEREGCTPNVLFPTGGVIQGDRLLLYNGAADEITSLVEVRLSDVLGALHRV